MIYNYALNNAFFDLTLETLGLRGEPGQLACLETKSPLIFTICTRQTLLTWDARPGRLACLEAKSPPHLHNLHKRILATGPWHDLIQPLTLSTSPSQPFLVKVSQGTKGKEEGYAVHAVATYSSDTVIHLKLVSLPLQGSPPIENTWRAPVGRIDYRKNLLQRAPWRLKRR
ncbi:hypothetical protein SAY87_003998 [Trapa incisa]|uniref:Uncharacterized protein n=1 Tax=Trapa incisa TaxID=236973 RepID=A0AAN7JN36_9MYRT|nr:hypothetical protein SAY87_003998 [Trapa incisa]